MKETVYTCNLCKQKKITSELYGIDWEGRYGHEVPRLRSWADSYNNHICKVCLENLKKGVDKG